MTARLILKYPDPRLHRRSDDVTDEDWLSNVDVWCKDISDTMIANAGLGLAAPQVDIHKRIFAVNAKDLDRPELFDCCTNEGIIFFINPTLSYVEPEVAKSLESCLSVPGVMYPVKRSPVIDVTYRTPTRELRYKRVVGEDAVVIQHEYDHLDGKLFVNRLGTIYRKEFMKRFEAPKREKTAEEISHLREQKRARARKNRKK